MDKIIQYIPIKIYKTHIRQILYVYISALTILYPFSSHSKNITEPAGDGNETEVQ